MKKIIIILVGLLFINYVDVQGQSKKEVTKEIKTEIKDSDKPGMKKIRIEKNINGKKEIIEKEIEMGEDFEIEDFSFESDSLMDGNGKAKIIMKKNNEFTWEEDEYFGKKNNKNPRIYGFRKYDDSFSRIGRDLDFEMDRLLDRIDEIPHKLPKEKFYRFDNLLLNQNDNQTIKSLEVFTNRPETEILNIKFYAPYEGDVNVLILNLKGEVIAKSESKNFQGEYVGQLKLNKKDKGTFVVLVSQGEDGATKKVTIN
jgi:hypothetical protein